MTSETKLKENINKIKRFRQFIAKTLERPLYKYQRQPTDKIIESVCRRDGEEFQIEISRQGGKTEGITQMVIALASLYKKLFKKVIQIGIFSPQKEQSKTDFDRIKDYFQDIQNKSKQLNNIYLFEHEEKNGTTYELTDGKEAIAKIYCFSASLTSNTESKTLDLIIIEEAQDINDKKREKTIYPMGAATNATKVNIGVAGYKLCYFYKQLQEKKNCFITDFEEVIKQKQRAFEKDGNDFHLNYESYVKQRLTKISKESDEFKTQYRLLWILEKGMFVTQEKLYALRIGSLLKEYAGTNRLIVACDSAKHECDTVVTIMEATKNKLDILAWILLHGDDYPDQVDYIYDFVTKFYKGNLSNIEFIFDSTGNQDYMADCFKKKKCRVTYFVFTAPSKDSAYRFFDDCIKEKILSYPKEESKERLMFEEQMLELEKEYKTSRNYLLPHKPDKKGAKDDFCDSAAMAVWKAKQAGFVKFSGDFVKREKKPSSPKEAEKEFKKEVQGLFKKSDKRGSTLLKRHTPF